MAVNVFDHIPKRLQNAHFMWLFQPFQSHIVLVKNGNLPHRDTNKDTFLLIHRETRMFFGLIQAKLRCPGLRFNFLVSYMKEIKGAKHGEPGSFGGEPQDLPITSRIIPVTISG